MRRRDFIALFGGAAVAWPLTAQAQRPAKVPLLGYLTADSEAVDLPRRNAFREGLQKLGYDEGETIRIEYRTAAGNAEKLSAFAMEFSHLNVDVVFAFSAGATQAAAKAMPSTPIVSISPDPVAAGLVASLARPGGNITGLSTLAGTEIYGKHLELLKEVVPNLGRVAVLSNPAFSTSALLLNVLQTSAPALGLSLQIVEARQPAELVARYRLPAIYGIEEHVTAGGLMAYAASRPEIFRRAATFVDKILKGAKPADLPVEQPIKFELFVNLKTAKVIGITIPESMLFRADKVIR